MQQKVIIIGVSFSSRLALARSIGVLGYDITIVAWSASHNASKTVDGYSRYVSRVLFCQKEEQAFIQLLHEKCQDEYQKVILVPDCDFSVSVIDKHQYELSTHFCFPNIKHQQGAIVEWSDKEKQKELASKLGMNVAKSITIDITNGEYVIPKSLTYPCFPKALASVSGGKAGMRKCENQAELEYSLQEIIKRKNLNTKVMIEDYMQIDKEYAVLGFSNGNSVSIPGVIRFIVGSRTQHGIALQGKIMPIKGFEQMIGLFKQFILSIGFVGLFDIDFYKSNEKLYFSELNLRYGGSGYSVVKMGVNLPAMFVESLIGCGEIDMSREVMEEAVYTNERMCFNDLVNTYISPLEYIQYIRRSDILFIEDDDDNRPYIAYKEMLRRAILQYYPKKFLRWIKK